MRKNDIVIVLISKNEVSKWLIGIFYVYLHISKYTQISSSNLKLSMVVTQRRKEREKKREELSCFYSFLYREKIQPQDRSPQQKHFLNSLAEEWRSSAQRTQTNFHKTSNKEMISLPKGLLLKYKTGDGGWIPEQQRGVRRGERCPEHPGQLLGILTRSGFSICTCALIISWPRPSASPWGCQRTACRAGSRSLSATLPHQKHIAAVSSEMGIPSPRGSALGLGEAAALPGGQTVRPGHAWGVRGFYLARPGKSTGNMCRLLVFCCFSESSKNMSHVLNSTVNPPQKFESPREY